MNMNDAFFQEARSLAEAILRERDELLGKSKHSPDEELDVDAEKETSRERVEALGMAALRLGQVTELSEEDEQPPGGLYISFLATQMSTTAMKFAQYYQKSMANSMDFMTRARMVEYSDSLVPLVRHFLAACEILLPANANATEQFRSVLSKAEDLVVLTDLLVDSALAVDSSQLLQYYKTFSDDITDMKSAVAFVCAGRRKSQPDGEAETQNLARIAEDVLPPLFQYVVVSAKNISKTQQRVFAFNQAAQIRERALVDVFELLPIAMAVSTVVSDARQTIVQSTMFDYDPQERHGKLVELAYRPPRPRRQTETTRSQTVMNDMRQSKKQRKQSQASAEGQPVDPLREYVEQRRKRKASAESMADVADVPDSPSKSKSRATILRKKKDKDGKKKKKASKYSSQTISRATANISLKPKRKTRRTSQNLEDAKLDFANDVSSSVSALDALMLDSDSPTPSRRETKPSKDLGEMHTSIKALDKESRLEEIMELPKKERKQRPPLLERSMSDMTSAMSRQDSAESEEADGHVSDSVMDSQASSLASASDERVALKAANAAALWSGSQVPSARPKHDERILDKYAATVVQVLRRLDCLSPQWQSAESLAKIEEEVTKSLKLAARRSTLIAVKETQKSTSRVMASSLNRKNSIVREVLGRRAPDVAAAQPAPDAFEVSTSWKKTNANAKVDLSSNLPMLNAVAETLGDASDVFIEACLKHVDVDTPQNELLAQQAALLHGAIYKVANAAAAGGLADFLSVPLAQLMGQPATHGVCDEDFIRNVSTERTHIMEMICRTHTHSIRQAAKSFASLIAQLVSTIQMLTETTSGSHLMQLLTVSYSAFPLVASLMDKAETARHIRLQNMHEKIVLGETWTESRVGSRGELSAALSQANLWEAHEKVEEGGIDPHSGTLNELVCRLTSPSASDEEFQAVFLATYRTFTTPVALACKLVDRYTVPEEFADCAMSVQLRVFTVVKALISTCYLDLTNSVVMVLREFIKSNVSETSEEMASSLSGLLEDMLARREASIAAGQAGGLVVKELISRITSPITPAALFMSTPNDQLAAQVTYHDFDIFQSILSREFFGLAWSKSKYRHRAPNIMAMIQRVNLVSYWVPSIVLWHTSITDRAKVIEKFIDLAVELRKLKNYSSLMGLIGGLNMSCVVRLKFTFSAVNELKMKKLEELQTLMNSLKSFGAYRKELAECTPPAVPYLGLFLSDLTFINDGNPDFVDDQLQTINFKKRGFMYKVLDLMKSYQSPPYDLEPQEPLLTFTRALPQLSDEDLYQLSLRREPRGAEIQDLLRM